MKKAHSNIKWDDAIIKAVEKCGGYATLEELYQLAPQIREVPSDLDVKHNIRAFLKRMTRISGKLKRIGLGMYALPNVKTEQTLFDELDKTDVDAKVSSGIINDSDLHSYFEGILVELGIVYDYLTYTADPSVLYRGKRLEDFTSLKKLPNFTSPSLVDAVKTIDVIWLKERSLVTMPKHAFDIEHTTDFTKALHRAYQLRDFKTTFYVVSSKRKNEQFKKKLETDPYKEISDRIFFRSYEDIISLYEVAIKHSELKEKFIIDT